MKITLVKKLTDKIFYRQKIPELYQVNLYETNLGLPLDLDSWSIIRDVLNVHSTPASTNTYMNVNSDTTVRDNNELPNDLHSAIPSVA